MTKKPKSPEFQLVLAGGLVAGVLSAASNDLYALVYRTATGFDFLHPSYGSITVSSVAPSLLAAAGYYALTRFTRHAARLLALVTALVTLFSFEGALHATLPDGSAKPPGFDALTLPMHVVVGAVAALFIPRFADEWARLRAWLAACRTPPAAQGG